jgi:hypothetical protein
MSYVADFFLFFGGFFVGFLLFKGNFKTKWYRIIMPEDVNRGPNADRMYFGIKVDGEEYAFTEEQLEVANERAAKTWR